MENSHDIKEVVFYSDCCPGQNRNIFIAVMFLYVLAYFKDMGELTIHHTFLIPGHTHVEADTMHAPIEKQKKRTSIDIELPRDWDILVST